VPITYVFDGEAVYAHSADGLKIRMMRANPHVCFEVDQRETGELAQRDRVGRSLRMAQALQEAGRTYALHIYPNDGAFVARESGGQESTARAASRNQHGAPQLSAA
jgi:hypothetical protein